MRLISLVAYLRTSLRLPVRTIRSYLEAVHDFVVSVGEIVYLLDRLREATETTVSGLREQARRGTILHADETGWREGGQGGYIRHEDELFQFVLVEGLSADSNLAERSIRPMVVIRKISGGSRSPSGTKTRMALATLFETWKARGLNPFEQCLLLLSLHHNLPSPDALSPPV